jgi:copper(I)-binding protein
VKALLLTSLLLLASCNRGAPDIIVSDPWIRETVAGQSGTAAYVTIQNKGSGDDRLLSIGAPPPITATLHETSTENGVSSMRALENGLAVPAGATIPLNPGRAHIMTTGLTTPLRAGETLKLTLRFERSGEKIVDFKVAPAMGGMAH